MKSLCFFLLLIFQIGIYGQPTPQLIEEIQLEKLKPESLQYYWLRIIDNGMSQPVTIPVIVARGAGPGPVLGMTAALHGNELNGISVIHQVMAELDLKSLHGTIIAIPGLNAISIPLHQRRYFDKEDLNRNFPGKEKGNRSQQYVWQIGQKILSKVDYLVDMHTASFGRENTFYVRSDLSDTTMAKMALLQNADIVLNNKGVPSANEQISATRTMRAEAVLKGIPTITIEYGNPQVFQPELISRGKTGIQNIMSWLGMNQNPIVATQPSVICKKSYWLYIDQGGYLEVIADLNQKVKKNERIAILRNPFGDLVREYFCPEDGIVIGRSSNPVNMSGGRIIHLGILQNEDK
jgi:predicted deacylase